MYYVIIFKTGRLLKQHITIYYSCILQHVLSTSMDKTVPITVIRIVKKEDVITLMANALSVKEVMKEILQSE